MCEGGTPGYTSSFTSKLTSHLQQHFWLERACREYLDKLSGGRCFFNLQLLLLFFLINYFLLSSAARKFKEVPHLLTKSQFLGGGERRTNVNFHSLRLLA